MTEKEKQKLERNRREHAIKSLYYNRYLLVRYATALALFIYLHWTLQLYMAASSPYILALPITLLLFSGLAMWEMAQMYTPNQPLPKITTLFYRGILGVNLLLIIVCLFQGSAVFFPLFHTSVRSLSIIVSAHLLASLGVIGILLRLKRIERQADRQFRRIENYLASIT